MRLKTQALIVVLYCLAFYVPSAAAEKKVAKKVEITVSEPAVLWRNPSDLASRDLFYGPGGRTHTPRGVFSFLKEDLDGTNPKFTVSDADGVKWKVKLGDEARPETAATRFVWAVGYFADEDYYLPELRVVNVPARVKRGRKWIDPEGAMRGARLERSIPGDEKLGVWSWRDDPFTGTRQWNGLRVLLALMNGWDVKDVNNTVYERDHEQIYTVADLGATFGTPGLSWSKRRSKGDPKTYTRSRFIAKVTSDYVDFVTPARPSWVNLVNPKAYFARRRLRWVGTGIPRQDAKWMGALLARLSAKQIRSAFESAGYSLVEIEDYARIVEYRIAELNEL